MTELAPQGPHGASEEMGPETAENLPRVKQECKAGEGAGLFLPDLGLGVRRIWAQLLSLPSTECNSRRCQSLPLLAGDASPHLIGLLSGFGGIKSITCLA